MAIGKFLDPKNDFCFKRIFGTEKHCGILIHFINDVSHIELPPTKKNDLFQVKKLLIY